MPNTTTKSPSIIFSKFLPFWLFLVFFKFAAALHYELVSPLGEKLLPLWLVGLLMGGCSLGQLVLDFPAGYILDRYGYKRLLTITTFLFLFAGVFIATGLTIPNYLLSLFFSIFGWLFFGPGISAYILSHAPKQNAGKFISLRDVFSSSGVVLSAAVLPFVLMLPPSQIGMILFAIFCLAFILIMLSPKEKNSVHAEIKLPTQHHYIRRNYLSTTFKTFKKLNPASTMLFLLELSGSIFYGMIWFTVPLVISHQAGSGLLGLGLGVFDLAIVLLGFFLGNIADKGNKRTLIFFGLLIFSIAGMFLGFNFGWLFIIFGFLATSGDEMAGISLWSWLHSLDREHANDGTIASVITLGNDLGWTIGPMLAGIFFTLVGPTWTIVIGAVPIFLTWIIYQIVVKKAPLPAIDAALVPRKPHRARHKT